MYRLLCLAGSVPRLPCTGIAPAGPGFVALLTRLLMRLIALQSKGKSKTNRIRAGSPQEEEHLAKHVLGLAPSAATCSEARPSRTHSEGRAAAAFCST